MRGIAAFVLFTELAIAQTRQPFQNQSPSSVVYGINKDGQQTIEIVNVTYEVTGTQQKGIDIRSLAR
jgi:hypothetical protein